MYPVGNEDLEAIGHKLDAIEQKIGNKWGVAITVAVISGIIGIATVVVQVYLDQQASSKRMVLEQKLQEQSATRRLNLEQDLNFFNSITSCLVEVDESFRETCLRPLSEKSEIISSSRKLAEALRQYRTVIEKYRYNFDNEFFSKLKDYNELVATNYFKIDSVKLQPERTSFYEKSKFDMEEVDRGLQRFFEDRIKPYRQ
jgi:predicted molibdopterin-dependent oxidoreductase YjgC